METTTSASQSTVDTAAERTLGGVDRAAQTAHETIDRLAAKAAPMVDKLRSKTSDTADTLRARADALSEWQEQWTENARSYVRENPLTAIAIGVVAGMVIAKISSSR